MPDNTKPEYGSQKLTEIGKRVWEKPFSSSGITYGEWLIGQTAHSENDPKWSIRSAIETCNLLGSFSEDLGQEF